MGRGGAASALQTAFISTCRTARRASRTGEREREREDALRLRAREAPSSPIAASTARCMRSLRRASRSRRSSPSSSRSSSSSSVSPDGAVETQAPSRSYRPPVVAGLRRAALPPALGVLPPAEPLPPRLLRLLGRLLAAPHLVLAVLLVPARQAPHDGARPPVAQQRHGVALVLGTVRRELRGGALPEGAAGGDGRVEVGRDDGRRRRGV